MIGVELSLNDFCKVQYDVLFSDVVWYVPDISDVVLGEIFTDPYLTPAFLVDANHIFANLKGPVLFEQQTECNHALPQHMNGFRNG